MLETHIDLLPPPATPILFTGPLPTQPRFVMRHAHRSFLLQFMPGTFALNTLRPYLGWQTMEEDIRATWQQVQEVLGITQVTHIAVRYINRVPLILPLEESRGWLVDGPYLSAAVVEASPPFQSRIQMGTGTGNVTTLSISHQNMTGEADPTMIVDLERTLSGDFSAGTAEIVRQADALHTDIWDMFKSIKGPRWNNVLEGKP